MKNDKIMNHPNTSSELIVYIFMQVKILSIGIFVYLIGLWTKFIPQPEELISGIIMSIITASIYYISTKILKFIDKKFKKEK